MKPSHRPTLIVVLLTALLAAPVWARFSAQLGSRHLARGEISYLEIILPTRPTQADLLAEARIPAVPGVEIVSRGEGFGIRTGGLGRPTEYSMQFTVRSYTVGRHTIPAIEIATPSETYTTQPLDFEVFDPATLEWGEVTLAQQRSTYSAAFRILRQNPYPGENVPVEIKLYLDPFAANSIADWGVPEFQTDGVASWRLEPSPVKGSLAIGTRTFAAVAFTSTLAATREGTVAIGPASLRLTSRRLLVDPRMGPRQLLDEATLQIPRLEFETTPLPPGAPEGFENAIGNFSLRASTSQTDVREGDPIAVDLVVSGSGNLDTLRPPRLVSPEDWKIYEASSTLRGDERRQLSGTTIFQQLIKPLGIQNAVPPFRLVFFDPATAEYRSVATAPIPLTVLPSTTASATAPAGPPQTLAVPVEKMTDILANLPAASLLIQPASTLPRWTGHAVAATIAALLILRILWLHLVPHLARKPRHILETRALNELARSAPDDDRAFLKQAGAFIERWLGSQTTTTPELQSILQDRDDLCFRSDSPGLSLGKRRTAILAALRKALRALPALALLGALAALATPQARAATEPDTAAQAQAAFDAADYEQAIRLWLGAGPYEQLSADTLYHIGNACYRLGSPGHAALYYRRALVRDPGHAEARQNLRFIERKCGAITIQRPEYQYTLARVPLSVWTGGIWTGVWLVVLGVLVFPATRTGARLRVPAVAGIILGPMIAACGLLGWYYYPDDASFAPLDRQAVIVADNPAVHTDASRTSPEVIEAPAGSVCEIIRVAGDWAYISFATQTRGWIPVDAIEAVLPSQPQAVPTIRKPTATERSA